MSLQEWCDKYKTYHLIIRDCVEDSCVFVAISDYRKLELWNLSDYKVTTAADYGVWLVSVST